jgi:glycosyltransferase involved in cell wall biosynthesis
MRLHQGLLRCGVDSLVFTAIDGGDAADARVRRYRPPQGVFARTAREVRRAVFAASRLRYRRSRPAWVHIFSDDRSVHAGQVLPQLPQADVIHVHAMIGFLDYRFLLVAVGRAPVVRTLHDMNFFTGGCHYDYGCGRFATGCGTCPQLGSSRENDLSRQVWLRKAALLARIPRERLRLAAPSRWLAAAARQAGFLRNFEVAVIPHGLDADVFAPRDRRFCRQLLGIPVSARVVLFVAHPLTRREKGFAFLAEALNRLGDVRDLMLVSAGGGPPPAAVPVPHLRLGHVRGERLLSAVYGAADLLVAPSIADTSPQVVLEAQACGTPVVAFAEGGIPEVVRHGATGLVVPTGDTSALAEAIRHLLQADDVRTTMGERARQVVLDEHTLEVQARRYMELYRTALGGQHEAYAGAGRSAKAAADEPTARAPVEEAG